MGERERADDAGRRGERGQDRLREQRLRRCHTYQPAGATGKIGPDLDKLPQYAEQAKKPLDDFVRESIQNPSAYIQPGFPNVMPPFSSLPKDQIDALVTFLTQSSS